MVHTVLMLRILVLWHVTLRSAVNRPWQFEERQCLHLCGLRSPTATQS